MEVDEDEEAGQNGDGVFGEGGTGVAFEEFTEEVEEDGAAEGASDGSDDAEGCADEEGVGLVAGADDGAREAPEKDAEEELGQEDLVASGAGGALVGDFADSEQREDDGSDDAAHEGEVGVGDEEVAEVAGPTDGSGSEEGADTGDEADEEGEDKGWHGRNLRGSVGVVRA